MFIFVCILICLLIRVIVFGGMARNIVKSKNIKNASPRWCVFWLGLIPAILYYGAIKEDTDLSRLDKDGENKGETEVKYNECNTVNANNATATQKPAQVENTVHEDRHILSSVILAAILMGLFAALFWVISQVQR